MHDDLVRTVVVTGGSRGIGADITRAFSAAGWRVVIGSRSEPDFADGHDIVFIPTDVRQPESLEALASQTVESCGRLDAWVNCAGFSAWRSIGEVDEGFWDDMLDTNLKGTFFGCKAAAARLGPGGAIVNISSLAGRRGSANNSVYCASKFGVTAVTQSLAKELGVQGIRVNAVCPVYVQTEGLLEALADQSSPVSGGDVAAYLAQFAAEQSSLKRLPLGEEVAAAVLWLASEGSSAVTGQSLNVDCGVMPI
ncbi:MAG: SDR family oxidoreductase [Deltaproteobacteria bacterium]|nr:SDR family oxidoreductase [Deltaproteobacteria bacterium]